jgi:invasion protein IalB
MVSPSEAYREEPLTRIAETGLTKLRSLFARHPPSLGGRAADHPTPRAIPIPQVGTSQDRYEPAAGLGLVRPLAAAAVMAALAFLPCADGPRAQETPGAQESPRATPGTPEDDPAVTRTQQYEEWLVRCGRPGGEEVCEMVQQPVGENGKPVMAVAVGKVPGNPNPGMIILLPLGISLPPGVSLRIDGGAEIPARVERCERQGCQVEMLLEPDLLSALKGGSRATVDFHVQRQDRLQRVRVPVSLLGFTAALNEVSS